MPSLLTIDFLHITLRDRMWRVDTRRSHDLSIPLTFDGAQPNFFGAPVATATALSAGSFIGDVRRGGSCNCATYSLTPHCNGTHTECIGHVTTERLSVRDVATSHFSVARLVTVEPVSAAVADDTTDPAPQPDDLVITSASLQAAATGDDWSDCTALIVRTLPNSQAKQSRAYGPETPLPYFSANAMRWIVEHGIRHLVVDVPSVDRAADQGRLTAHRIFWGLPAGATDAQQATRADATITEFAYIDDSVADGRYMLNLQVAPFQADAAPSRPILFPLEPFDFAQDRPG